MVSEWVDETNKQLDLEAAKAKGSKNPPKACICNRLILKSKLMFSLSLEEELSWGSRF